MKINDSHRESAKKAFENGKRSLEVHSILESEGLTKSQSNSVIRSVRKKLGIYRKKEEVKRKRKPKAKEVETSSEE